MKKLILSVTAIAGLAMAGSAQQVFFHDSNAANATSNDVTIGGVVDVSTDLNLELLTGTTAGTVTTDVVTLLLSQATATPTTGLGTVQPGAGDISKFGLIADTSGNAYTVPAGTDFYQVLAWLGTSSTFPGAGLPGTGESPVLMFDSPPAAGAPAVQIDLANDIAVSAAVIPEPTTLAMAGVGLASMLFFRRKNK